MRGVLWRAYGHYAVVWCDGDEGIGVSAGGGACRAVLLLLLFDEN